MQKKKLKKLAVMAAVVIGILALIPIPLRIKDGGSLHFRPVIPLYTVTRWNGYGHDETLRTAGVTVTLLGMEVYSNFHEELKDLP